MFKPLRPELLEGLHALARAARQNRTALIQAYVAEALEHRGLAVREQRGNIRLSAAGRKLLDEHIKRGLVAAKPP